jgi:hypothetical protein
METITPEILRRVWQEFDFRIDVCQITKVGHMQAF